MELNEQRQTVFLDRYALKGTDGQPIEQDPDEMWWRVARAIADNPTEQMRFYDLLKDFKFVPGGRILSSAGTGTETTFYNCYVVPVETKARRARRGMANEGFILTFPEGVTAERVESMRNDVRHLLGASPDGTDHGNDSREAIIDTVGVMVDILSRGGGVGVNWSVLRPKGAYLKRLNGTSSGPVDWMHFASTAVGTVEQGGSRRGAAMFMLDDWHPDLLEFIDAKRDLKRITNANVSVAVSDLFMQAVKNDEYWATIFPDTSHEAYDREWDGDIVLWQDKGYPVLTYATHKARDIWRKLAEAAWDNGEPGVVFLDRYNKLSTGDMVERLISVNPCGEQGLGPYSVCNLGSMNLAAYVRQPAVEGAENFDRGRFEDDVEAAVRFLDNVIDKNFYFLPENEKAQKDLRRIGLGVMGLADALVKLGYRYGSPAAVEFTEMIFRSMKDVAIETSAALAREKGAAPAWDKSMWERPYLADYIDRHGFVGLGQPDLKIPALRNIFLLTQAPTGTTSILAGVYSGIEPYFALGYWREDRTGKHWVQPAAVDEVWPEGTYKPSFLVTANEVTVEEHIAMQAAAQKYIDSSVSKTINAPNSHTVEDVEKAYTLAYESGLKGLAYFRDGCGRAQVLYTDKTEAAEEKTVVIKPESLTLNFGTPERKPKVRPDTLKGTTRKVRTKAGTAYVTVNRDEDGQPFEVFVNVGKAGSDVMELGEAIGRLISMGLQNGASLSDLGHQLVGIGGYSKFNRALPSAIGDALSAEDVDEFIGGLRGGVVEFEMDFETASDVAGEPMRPGDTLTTMPSGTTYNVTGTLCGDCQSLAVVREEGCMKCQACGWSAC